MRAWGAWDDHLTLLSRAGRTLTVAPRWRKSDDREQWSYSLAFKQGIAGDYPEVRASLADFRDILASLLEHLDTGVDVYWQENGGGEVAVEVIHEGGGPSTLSLATGREPGYSSYCGVDLGREELSQLAGDLEAFIAGEASACPAS